MQTCVFVGSVFRAELQRACLAQMCDSSRACWHAAPHQHILMHTKIELCGSSLQRKLLQGGRISGSNLPPSQPFLGPLAPLSGRQDAVLQVGDQAWQRLSRCTVPCMETDCCCCQNCYKSTNAGSSVFAQELQCAAFEQQSLTPLRCCVVWFAWTSSVRQVRRLQEKTRQQLIGTTRTGTGLVRP